MLMAFKDRVILVTGAASGMGRALCQLMGSRGAALALVDRNEAGLKSLEHSLQAAGVSCAAAVADVRSRSEVHAAVDDLVARMGPVDILLASAGVCGIWGMDDLQVAKLEEIVQVNFLGVVYAIEAVLPQMLRRGSGQLVGVSSLAAFRGLPFEGAYCASKAALASYLESLRPSLRRRGIAVTTVFPGYVETPLLQDLVATAGSKAFRGAVSAEEAARKIALAVERRYRVYCFPWTTTWLMHLVLWLRPRIFDFVMTRLARRVPLPY
jgi:short-subunit dehydrogenase